jgi:hypothetical protein
LVDEDEVAADVMRRLEARLEWLRMGISSGDIRDRKLENLTPEQSQRLAFWDHVISKSIKVPK